MASVIKKILPAIRQMKSPHLRTIGPKRPSLNIQKISQIIKQYKVKTVWGLDIGGHALKAVKVSKTSDELVVEDLDIIEYRALSPDVNSLQSPHLKEVIQAFLTKYHIAKSDNLLVSIPGQFVLSRFTTIPPVAKKQLKDLVTYEAKQQIPFDLKDVVWNYQRLSETIPGVEGIEIGLFASKRAILDQLLTNIAPLKPNLIAFQVSPLAIFNFISFDQQIDGQTIVINVETENTDLVIVNGPHLWLRSIPLSTVDTDLIKEINRSLEYYKSLTKETINFQTLLLMGNSFKDPINVKTLAENFTCNVKIVKTLKNLKLSGKIDPVYFNENLVNLNVALGLALQGVGLGRVTINLLPQELVRALEISRKKPYAVATLGCLALSLIIQYCGLHIRINHLHSSKDYHEKVLQNVKDLEKKYKDAETLAQTNKSTLELISSIDSSRFFWMEALDKLLSLMPDNVYITNIQPSWVDADAIKDEDTSKQTTSGFFQTKNTITPKKTGISKKVLLMGIKGESKEPSIAFIEENVLKPIQTLTLFDQKVAAFKKVEIVPGSCRQVDHNDGWGSYISFEIRWIVKSQDDIQAETKSLTLTPGTSTPSVKS